MCAGVTRYPSVRLYMNVLFQKVIDCLTHKHTHTHTHTNTYTHIILVNKHNTHINKTVLTLTHRELTNTNQETYKHALTHIYRHTDYSH